MYNTSFEHLRHTVTCIVNEDSINLVDTIVDTGARWTCYRADIANPYLEESQLVKNQYKGLGGFVDGKNTANTVRFYQYNVKQFTIGDIDLGKRSIWITFDERVIPADEVPEEKMENKDNRNGNMLWMNYWKN